MPDADNDASLDQPLVHDVDFRDASDDDTDGDGIADPIDVDDDNDGILDTVEDGAIIFEELEITPLIISQANLTTFTDSGLANGLGDTALYANVVEIDGQAIDLLLTVEHIDSPNLNVNIAGFTQGEFFPILLTGADNSSGVTFVIEYFLAGTTTPVEVPAGLTFRDIDNTAPGEAVQLLVSELDGFTLSNSPATSITPDLNSSSFIDGQEGIFASFTSSASGNPSSENIQVSVGVGSASRIEFNVLKRNGNTGYSFQPTAFTDPVSFSIDFDNDGLINSLDIDSDNDGITDNIEAQTTVDYIAPSGIEGGITDVNMDGLDDAFDARSLSNGGAGLNVSDAAATEIEALIAPVDTDSDGTIDAFDTDSDNDGANDTLEADLGNARATGVSDNTTDADGCLLYTFPSPRD